ncbi:PfkB family carbohydrate kinase [Citrobacter amalonaticus]|uniref:PfkB family carbohydrate kinase n=1 Tax=Citrobacter amalonaticus TaxID=35703 RepID=UPI0019044D32|nr:PfkB family carbohydrate kinase [Citrobacter amalonaticus]MBJ9277526.1 DeoR family transcriptional regulator [Citrobacter amalonaticus]
MFLEERRTNILIMLIQQQRVTVNNLAKLFAVSKETIRSDLNFLEKNKSITRCHGGAVLNKKQLLTNFQNGILTNINESLKKKSMEKYMSENKKGKVCILGSFNVDIVSHVARLPKPGETLISKSCSFGPGGKGANQAVAASNAMSQVHFITKVGNDQFNSFAYEHLESSNINALTIYISDSEPTGNAVIYVSDDDGENIIAINQGANITLTDEEVINVYDRIVDANVLLVQLENNISAIRKAMSWAHDNNVRVILNPAPFTSEVKVLLPYVDIITPNQTEASLLSGIEVVDLVSARKAAEIISAMGPECVIITLGSKGGLLLEKGAFSDIPVYPALVVDTTGAGDAFNGAFAAALSRGDAIKNACNYAAAFSSLAVELNGASNMPRNESVNERIRTANPSKI